MAFVLVLSIVPGMASREPGGITVWDEIYPELRHRNFNYPEKLDEELLRVLYRIVREVGGRLNIHSDYRPERKGVSGNIGQAMSRIVNSQHKFGIAVDFRLDDYTNMSRQERLFVYHQKTQWIEVLLRKYEIYDKVGLGIYPFATNPFWHIDVRGVKARWCRDKNRQYKGYASCKKEMEKELGPFKSYSSYPELPPVGVL